MEKKFELKIRSIAPNLTVTIGIWLVIYEGSVEIARSKTVIENVEKGTVLEGLVFDTSFGPVALADYPAEAAYIAAKWAE